MSEPTAVAGDQLLSTAQVSGWLGVKQETLRFWRWEKRGPRSFKLGSGKRAVVRYKASDVQAWLDDQYAATNGAA